MRMGLKFNRIISQVKHEMPPRILLCLKGFKKFWYISRWKFCAEGKGAPPDTFEDIILQHMYTQVRASMIRCLEAILRCINMLSVWCKMYYCLCLLILLNHAVTRRPDFLNWGSRNAQADAARSQRLNDFASIVAHHDKAARRRVLFHRATQRRLCERDVITRRHTRETEIGSIQISQ